MRHFIKGLFVLFLFCSCNKTDVIAPSLPVEQENFFANFKDVNISIVKITGKQTATNQITFTFSTEFENNLSSIEVYSSANDRSLCNIFEKQLQVNSTVLKQYSIVDLGPKIGNNYYLIKYTTKKGEWAISPMYTIALK